MPAAARSSAPTRRTGLPFIPFTPFIREVPEIRSRRMRTPVRQVAVPGPAGAWSGWPPAEDLRPYARGSPSFDRGEERNGPAPVKPGPLKGGTRVVRAPAPVPGRSLRRRRGVGVDIRCNDHRSLRSDGGDVLSAGGDHRTGDLHPVRPGPAVRPGFPRRCGPGIGAGPLLRLPDGFHRTGPGGAGCVLDAGGLLDVRVVASGGLDEYAMDELVRTGAPIDIYAVGTRVGVSASPTNSHPKVACRWWRG